jgi:excisionase family DNA binding protein
MDTSALARRFPRTGVPDDRIPEFYTVAQLARRLQFTKMTIHRMVSRGELPCYLFGRVKRFHHADVEAFLTRCRSHSAGYLAASPLAADRIAG